MKFNYAVFETQKNKYLFDGTSCNIFEIENWLFNNHKYLFGNISNNTYKDDKEFSREYNEILSAYNEKLIMPVSNNDFRYWFDTDKYREELFNEIHHLMIGITEKCNMRCKYCVYGGHYKNERTHSEINIDNNILKQTIEYFYKISKSNKKIINFYGGEPFINFEAIKKTVEYVNTIDNNIEVYITTNATILTNEVIEWFSTNKNIHLFVSIAGIPIRHDELRIFSNLQPTFDTIKNNLINLKKYDYESYINRVRFVFNIFDEIQLIELQEFWEQDDIFKETVHLPEITFIDCIDDDGTINKLRKNVIGKYSKEINPLKKYIDLITQKNFNNIIVKHYDEKLLRVHKRLINSSENILSGICRPFINKMFIDINGNINLCENFKYELKLGNVYDGFSIDSVEELLTLYKNNRSKTCINCWATKLCSLCFRDVIDSNGAINKERAKEICNNERNSLLHIIKEYCIVMENEVGLLEHLDDYIIHT